MKMFSSDTTRNQALALFAATIGLSILAYSVLHHYVAGWMDPVILREWIDGFGIFAPVVYIAVQALQVIVAPVPGQVTALAGGYLFGPLWGTLYSLIGITIGSAIAFGLAKRYGRPYVERIIDSKVIQQFDSFTERAGVPGLFAFVLLPGLPDDAVCFLFGLTKIKILPFLTIMIVGRLPALAVTTIAGGSLASGRIYETLLLLGLLGILSTIVFIKRKTVISLLVP